MHQNSPCSIPVLAFEMPVPLAAIISDKEKAA
jgi:hypothetical protein